MAIKIPMSIQFKFKPITFKPITFKPITSEMVNTYLKTFMSTAQAKFNEFKENAMKNINSRLSGQEHPGKEALPDSPGTGQISGIDNQAVACAPAVKSVNQLGFKQYLCSNRLKTIYFKRFRKMHPDVKKLYTESVTTGVMHAKRCMPHKTTNDMPLYRYSRYAHIFKN